MEYIFLNEIESIFRKLVKNFIFNGNVTVLWLYFYHSVNRHCQPGWRISNTIPYCKQCTPHTLCFDEKLIHFVSSVIVSHGNLISLESKLMKKIKTYWKLNLDITQQLNVFHNFILKASKKLKKINLEVKIVLSNFCVLYTLNVSHSNWSTLEFLLFTKMSLPSIQGGIIIIIRYSAYSYVMLWWQIILQIYFSWHSGGYKNTLCLLLLGLNMIWWYMVKSKSL